MSYSTELDNVLTTIYNEQPSYWPYGLSKEHFDGGCYLLKHSSTQKTLGFVGWQVRKHGSRKVGYYSVGILPEHRKSGYAKEALEKIISYKRSSVDAVHALIKKENTPSLELANRLQLDYIKIASTLLPAQKLPWMAKPIAYGLDLFTSPFQTAGRSFNRGGAAFQNNNRLQGLKQFGKGTANLGAGLLNLAALGTLSSAVRLSPRFTPAMNRYFSKAFSPIGNLSLAERLNQFGRGSNYLSRYLPDVNHMLKQIPGARQNWINYRRLTQNIPGARFVGEVLPEFGGYGLADYSNRNRLARQIASYKPTMLNTLNQYGPLLQGNNLF